MLTFNVPFWKAPWFNTRQLEDSWCISENLMSRAMFDSYVNGLGPSHVQQSSWCGLIQVFLLHGSGCNFSQVAGDSTAVQNCSTGMLMKTFFFCLKLLWSKYITKLMLISVFHFTQSIPKPVTSNRAAVSMFPLTAEGGHCWFHYLAVYNDFARRHEAEVACCEVLGDFIADGCSMMPVFFQVLIVVPPCSQCPRGVILHSALVG